MTDDALSPGGSCLQCGYNLTGLDDRRPCPECGLLVGLSRMDKSNLGKNHPQWLRTLTVGSVLLLLAMVLGIGTPIGIVSLAEQRQDRMSWSVGGFGWMSDIMTSDTVVQRLRLGVSIVVILAAPLLMLLGVVALTSRPKWVAQGRLAVVGLRVTAVVVFAAVTLLGLLIAGWSHLGVSEWLFGSTIIGGSVALMVLAATMSLWMKNLARRAPAPLLAADSPIVGFVLSGSIAYGLVTTLLAIVGYRLTDMVGRDSAFMITFLVVILGLTAAIWSIYLLIRYAIAFNKTRRQARRLFSMSAAPAA